MHECHGLNSPFCVLWCPSSGIPFQRDKLHHPPTKVFLVWLHNHLRGQRLWEDKITLWQLTKVYHKLSKHMSWSMWILHSELWPTNPKQWSYFEESCPKWLGWWMNFWLMKYHAHTQSAFYSSWLAGRVGFFSLVNHCEVRPYQDVWPTFHEVV